MATLVVVATIPAVTTLAVSQTAPREVLIGVSRVGSPTGSSESARLYESAMIMLRDGNVASGQRQLEQLVARFPDSAEADRARQDLAPLYAPLKLASAPTSTKELSRLGATDAIPAAAQSGGGWRTTVRPTPGQTRTAQDLLRDAAGDLVFFSDGSSELGARARKALWAQAQWLNQNTALPITIEGHADDPGSGAEAKALATARANAVRDRLVEEGVAAERIRVVSFGNARRVAVCGDDSCGSQNRRVATVVGGSARAQLP